MLYKRAAVSDSRHASGIQVLRKLLAEGRLPPALQAQGLLTACVVLEGQAAALVLDTRDFHRHLYRLAAATPSLSSAWSHGSTAAEGSLAASTLWVRSRALSQSGGCALTCASLSQVQTHTRMLLARSQRQVDTSRAAAFAKRLSAVRAPCNVRVHRLS